MNQALRAFIARRRQAPIVEIFGTIEFDAKYDYKQRRRDAVTRTD